MVAMSAKHHKYIQTYIHTYIYICMYVCIKEKIQYIVYVYIRYRYFNKKNVQRDLIYTHIHTHTRINIYKP